MTRAEKLTLIAENEQKVYNAGYVRGKSEGGDTTAAYEQGVEDGKTAEWSAFWDALQNYGNRTDYDYGFYGVGWNSKNFRPKYDIKPTKADYMFASFGENIDLKSILEECGVVLDTSQCTRFLGFFRYSSPSIAPVIDARSATSLHNFSINSSIKTIEKIILKSDGSQTLNTIFASAHYSLENVAFEGVIGSTINMANCPKLSVASMKSIISCLKNYKGTDEEFAYQIKFTDDCWAALEADSVSPSGGTWGEYIDSLGWLT